MSTVEIVAAAMRWYTAHQHRMDATREKGIADKRCKSMPTYSLDNGTFALKVRLGQAQDDAERLMTATKAAERQALKQLAKACQERRSATRQADDASSVIDMLALPVSTNTID